MLIDLEIIELLRIWEYWKGYYDSNSYQFKSVADFRLFYTVDEAFIKNSAHLHRLLNSTIRIPVKSFSDEEEQTMVYKLLESISEYLFSSLFYFSEDIIEKCKKGVEKVGVLLKKFGNLKAKKHVFTFCKSFKYFYEFGKKNVKFLKELYLNEMTCNFIDCQPNLDLR